MDRHGGGDDLDDDFVPDDLVALSDDEDAGGALPADTDDVNALLSADDDAPAAPSASTAAAEEKKRKRKAKDKERKAKVGVGLPEGHPECSSVLAQKRRTAETTEPVEPPSVAAQPPSALVDYLLSMQAKTFSKMSGIELADIAIPGTCASLHWCSPCARVDIGIGT